MTTSFQIQDLGRINETAFTSWFLDACDLTGWTLRYHTYRSTRSQPGFPDWTIWRERGGPWTTAKMMLVELKGWDTKVDPRQVRFVNATRNAGVPAYIWRPRHAEEAFLTLHHPPARGAACLPALTSEDYAK